MKKTAVLFIMCICMGGLAACAEEKTDDDIAADNIRHVNISGNAKSIILKQSTGNYFEFHNEDLDTTHTYEVYCDENGESLDINIMMEEAEANNNILGSFVIDIPEKEFDIIEAEGDFKQIYLYTMNSDVLIHANGSTINLDLEADDMDHNITLEGSESKEFISASVYFDKLPDNVKMELNTNQGGRINAPQNIFKDNGYEAGTGKPVISINNTKEINTYLD